CRKQGFTHRSAFLAGLLQVGATLQNRGSARCARRGKGTMETYVQVIQKGAAPDSIGYQIEVQIPGQFPVLLPKSGGHFSLEPFQSPEGVPEGRHRVLYCLLGGVRATREVGRDVVVDLDYGLRQAPVSPPTASPSPPASSPKAETGADAK